MLVICSFIFQIQACTLRGQLEFKFTKKPIPLSEVEDAASIVKRFCTGISFIGCFIIQLTCSAQLINSS